MHAAMSNVMVAIMLLHAVLGCCWHHSHAGEGGSDSPQRQASRAENPRHDHGRGWGPAGPHQDENGFCHEEKCVFVRPSQDDQDTDAASVCVDSITPSTSGAAHLSPALAWAVRIDAPSHHLPVRSHLAKQVLLI